MVSKRIILFFFTLAFAGAQTYEGLNPAVKSLLLPGWGETALNFSEQGRKFIYAETALWTAFAGAVVVSRNYIHLYQAFSAQYAGVMNSGKNRQYWVDVGNYMSMVDYNEEHLRFREYDAIYPVGENWEWSWTSESKRKQFRSYRVASDTWLKSAQFIAGGIVLNHLASAIHSQYLIKRFGFEKLIIVPVTDPESASVGFSIIFSHS